MNRRQMLLGCLGVAAVPAVTAAIEQVLTTNPLIPPPGEMRRLNSDGSVVTMFREGWITVDDVTKLTPAEKRDYRRLIPDVVPGFRREAATYIISPDGTVCHWTTMDKAKV